MSTQFYTCTGCGRCDFDSTNELMIHEQTCACVQNNDSLGRRVTDKVSTDKALELVAALAMEKALDNDDQEVISSVENAILTLRERIKPIDLTKFRGQKPF